MPVISRFYGMVVKIYFAQREHNPPHFHVIYGEYMGAFDIKTLKLLEGDLPDKASGLVREWAKNYQEELLQMWNTQEFTKLPPLE
jgi:hypothetical protein